MPCLVKSFARRLVIRCRDGTEAGGEAASPDAANSSIRGWRRAACVLLVGLAAEVLAATTLSATDTPALSAKERRAAQKLYETKCAKCHKFYHPDLYRPEEWRDWMEKMRRKARLKPDQYELLSRYLDTFRTPPG